MEEITSAIKDAERFERYLHMKTVGDGYLLWAALCFIGSLLTYLLEIFGEALEIDESYIGPAIGSIWLIMVSIGALFAFRIDPKTRTNLLDQEINDLNTKIGLSWGLSFMMGFILSFSLAGLSIIEQETAPLLGIGISISLGNVWIYFITKKKAGIALFVGLAVFLGLPLVAFSSEPYISLILGIVISLPYYIAGFYVYVSEIPKSLK